MKKSLFVLLASLFCAGLAMLLFLVLQTAWKTTHKQNTGAPSCEHLQPKPSHGTLGALPVVAPAFSLQNSKNQWVALSSFAGKRILLHFWASWCKPCLEELPALELLAKQMKNDPSFQIIAISADENWEAVKTVLPEEPSFTVLLDSNLQVANRYGTFGFPETYLIDTTGHIQLYWTGARRGWNTPATQECLADLR